MKPKTKLILKWIGILLGSILLIAIIFALYVNSIIPKFNSVPVTLQQELFNKPGQLFPMQGKFIYKSAVEIASIIRRQEASSVEVVSEFINQIKNNNYKYNALIFLREDEALLDAKQADMEIAKGDTIDKPLLGVPVTIKEMFWVKGSPSTMNAKMYGFIAPRNAIIVDQLRKAGAIIIGTTNDAYMLSDYQTQGEVYPAASNPYDTTRTPGGSTGGGAAAIAAGFSAIELGSDLGGSIRVPSVFCGLWALKPTFSAVNITDGTGPDSAFQYKRLALASPGPLAKTPGDLKLIWEVLAQTPIDKKFQKPIEWKQATSKNLHEYKLAWIDEWNTPNGNIKISTDVKQKLHLFIDSLKQHGVSTDKKAPDIYCDLEKMFLRTFGYQLGENQPWLIRKFIEMDFAKTDNGNGNFKNFHDAIMDASDAGWEKTEADRKELIAKWEIFFQSYDFFICPVTYGAAFKKQESWKPIPANDGITVPYLNYVPYTYIINSTGHPSLVVPLGLNSKGLPIGIQMVGRNFSENELLHFARLIEPLVPAFQQPR
jgi:amidase